MKRLAVLLAVLVAAVVSLILPAAVALALDLEPRAAMVGGFVHLSATSLFRWLLGLDRRKA